MLTADESGAPCSPIRLLEMLLARFGAFEAIACLSMELSRKGGDDLPMDAATAEAILEFGDDLRQAGRAVRLWSTMHGFTLDAAVQRASVGE